MWPLADKLLSSRLILGTALYPSPQIMQAAIKASGADMVTVGLRRQSSELEAGNQFWSFIKALDCHILPNTAGCRSADEAVKTAHIARELFETNWIKLETLGDDYNLQPDPFELLKATETLLNDGFEVLPYCTDDLVLCQRLQALGCKILMPWGSPIGTGKGLLNPYALQTLRARLPNIPLIIDSGIGTPAHAMQAMQMGYDGILLNSAVALAHDPVGMAEAFKDAVTGGYKAALAGLMPERDLAAASTPLTDTPFWHQESSS